MDLSTHFCIEVCSIMKILLLSMNFIPDFSNLTFFIPFLNEGDIFFARLGLSDPFHFAYNHRSWCKSAHSGTIISSE